jgi:hypothetical protein
MLGLEYDPHAPRFKLLLQPARDLGRKPLLYLQITSKELDDPRQLRQAHDPPTRQIPHVRHAMKRKEVMHTKRMERDRTDQHKLVIALLVGERRRAERLRRQQLGVCLDHSSRRVTQRLYPKVSAERNKKVGSRSLSRSPVNPTILVRRRSYKF